ncbi:MAG TPA: carboxylate--amine ligase [Myxococcaceae bacterium]|nr:carboxylate--amine ligase [Myxococcaceae bacterium]
MNVLFLSPNFPPQFHLFCRALREEGMVALGIGDSPPHDVSRPLAEAVTEYLYLRDLNQYDDVLRAVGYLTWRYGKIDRIDSLNEHWLPLEARLREDFNVEGPRPAELRRHRSKTAMREIFTAAGVPCTEGEPVTSPDQLRAFARRVGYPLVLKPDVGVGAWSTFKLAGPEALEAALRGMSLDGFVVEKFAHGVLTSYDGLCDREGRVIVETSHLYSTGVMDVVNEGLDVWYYNRRQIPQGLRALGKKVAEAFGIRERFFHIEFFEEPGGTFRALEINIRPPGGYTTDMMNFSADADVYRLWARALGGRDVSGTPFDRKYHCAHASRRYRVQYRVPHGELLSRLGPQLVLERPIPPALAAAMGDHEYLIRDADEGRLRASIDLIQARPPGSAE